MFKVDITAGIRVKFSSNALIAWLALFFRKLF
jgi:hypothetical protein